MVSVLASGAKKNKKTKKTRYATDSTVCLKKLRKTTDIVSQGNAYRNRFSVSYSPKTNSLHRNDAVSSEVKMGYTHSMWTGATSDSNQRDLIPRFEQVSRAKTADSGLLLFVPVGHEN
jgi:hypothetical protein